MVAIIDYDAGNLRSVEKALEAIGADVVITSDPHVIEAADHVILPGVGAFGETMEKLQGSGLIPVIHSVIKKKTPFLGICLGLQLLFDESDEAPGIAGLSILPGTICKIPAGEGLKIPHMGWNLLKTREDSRLFVDMPEHPYVYFVHSYYLKARDEKIVSGTTEYGVKIHAAVESENIFACQFHPEKSSSVGLKILKNFISMSREDFIC